MGRLGEGGLRRGQGGVEISLPHRAAQLERQDAFGLGRAALRDLRGAAEAADDCCDGPIGDEQAFRLLGCWRSWARPPPL